MSSQAAMSSADYFSLYPRLHAQMGRVDVLMVARSQVNIRAINYLLPDYYAELFLSLYEQSGPMAVEMGYQYVAWDDNKSVPLDQSVLDDIVFSQNRDNINRLYFHQPRLMAFRLNMSGEQIPGHIHFAYPFEDPVDGLRLRWAAACQEDKALHDLECLNCFPGLNPTANVSHGPRCIIDTMSGYVFPPEESLVFFQEGEPAEDAEELQVASQLPDLSGRRLLPNELVVSTVRMGPLYVPLPGIARPPPRNRELANLGIRASLDCAREAVTGNRCKHGRYHLNISRADRSPAVAVIGENVSPPPPPPLTTTIVEVSGSGAIDAQGMLPPPNPPPRSLSAVEHVRAMSVSPSRHSVHSASGASARTTQPMSISAGGRTSPEPMSVDDEPLVVDPLGNVEDPPTVQLFRSPRVTVPVTPRSATLAGFGYIRTGQLGSDESTLVLLPSTKGVVPSSTATSSTAAVRHQFIDPEPMVIGETDSMKSFGLNLPGTSCRTGSRSTSAGPSGEGSSHSMEVDAAPSAAAASGIVKSEPPSSAFSMPEDFLYDCSESDLCREDNEHEQQLQQQRSPSICVTVGPSSIHMSVASSRPASAHLVADTSSMHINVASPSLVDHQVSDRPTVKVESPSVFSLASSLAYDCTGQQVEGQSAPVVGSGSRDGTTPPVTASGSLPFGTSLRLKSETPSILSNPPDFEYECASGNEDAALMAPPPAISSFRAPTVKASPASAVFSAASSLGYDCGGSGRSSSTVPTGLSVNVDTTCPAPSSGTVCVTVKPSPSSSVFSVASSFGYDCGGSGGSSSSGPPGPSATDGTTGPAPSTGSVTVTVKASPSSSVYSAASSLIYDCGSSVRSSSSGRPDPSSTVGGTSSTVPAPSTGSVRVTVKASPSSSVFSVASSLGYDCGGGETECDTASVRSTGSGERTVAPTTSAGTSTSRGGSIKKMVKIGSPSSYPLPPSSPRTATVDLASSMATPADFGYDCAADDGAGTFAVGSTSSTGPSSADGGGTSGTDQAGSSTLDGASAE